MSLDSPNGHSPKLAAKGVLCRADPGAVDRREAFCPRCGHKLDDVGTPGVTVGAIVDDQLAVALHEDGQETFPVFGWRCSRHRETVVVATPAEGAPENYASIDIDYDGLQMAVATPKPFLADYMTNESTDVDASEQTERTTDLAVSTDGGDFR